MSKNQEGRLEDWTRIIGKGRRHPVADASPFGRQPKPVIVRLEGEPEDVSFWRRELARRAEYKGDAIGLTSDGSFTIYPRAVND